MPDFNHLNSYFISSHGAGVVKQVAHGGCANCSSNKRIYDFCYTMPGTDLEIERPSAALMREVYGDKALWWRIQDFSQDEEVFWPFPVKTLQSKEIWPQGWRVTGSRHPGSESPTGNSVLFHPVRAAENPPLRKGRCRHVVGGAILTCRLTRF